jgi:iron complex outermembrane receptor protein
MKKFYVLAILIFFGYQVFAQKLSINGQITNLNNGRPIKGAKILVVGTTVTASTDSGGFFQVTQLVRGSYEIKAIAEGYHATQIIYVVKRDNSQLKLRLIPSNVMLDEVIVKDKRLQVRKKEESLNIEIVNADFIQRNLGGSLMKTLERLPGIKTIGIGSGQSKPLIRGLGFNRVVVLDRGIKHEGQQWGADHGLEIDQFAAGEVELLKGAASFTYGSDAIGGAINIKPAPVPAPNSFGGSVDLIGKTNNNLYGSSANLFARNKNWFYDARATFQNYGDYRVPTDKVYVYDYEVKLADSYLRNTAGQETGLHLNTGFLGENFRSIFYLSNSFNKSGFFANAHGLEPRRVDETLHDASARDILMPSQQVNHFKLINKTELQLNRHQLAFEIGYQRNFRQEFSQYVNHGYMPSSYPADLKIPENLEREFDKQVYSLNLKDKITHGKHEITLGTNTEYQNNQINGWTFLVPAFKQFSSGAFIYDKFKLSENSILHGAIRYDYGQIRMQPYTDWFTSDVTSGKTTVSEKLVRAANLNRTFNSLVWSAGINYNLSQFALKFNVGKSFRMPIAKELGANGVNYHYFSYERGNPNLDAEKSYQADLSLSWNADRWSVQFSPFYNYFPNYIYLNPTPNYDYFYGAGNQVFQYSQSSVMRYGAELQFKYCLFKNLSAEVLGEYLYAEQLSGDKKGYTLPFSPPQSVLFNLTYTLPQIGKLQDSYFSVDYRITSKQDNIVPPEKKTQGYQVLNVQAGTKLHLYKQPIMISLQAQNLLDTKYLNHTSFYRLIELPEAGRNIILSLKIPFKISNTHN